LKEKISSTDTETEESNENIDIEYVDVDEYILTGTYYDEFKDVF